MRELNRAECETASGGAGKTIKFINGPIPPGTPANGLTGTLVTSPPEFPTNGQINSNSGTGSTTSTGNNGLGNYPSPTQDCGATWIGTHDVYDTTLTSKDPGQNNPGDVSYGDWAIKHGAAGFFVAQGGKDLAEFPTEQEGIYTLGCLLDGSYANDSISSFARQYLGADASAATVASYTSNVEQYMKSFGYSNFDSTIQSLSNDEFNTLLDGIALAEGKSNTPPAGTHAWTTGENQGC